MLRRPLRISLDLAAGYLAAAALILSSLVLHDPALAQADDNKRQAEVPIERVVMFNSGVAFYEHSGSVTGDASVDLQFNVKDVNDLLKSMVVQDLGGGRISTVSYGSKDPITRTLQTFSIDLTNSPTMADLLNQIRGEKIEVTAVDKIVGSILSVETRVKVIKEETKEQQYLNLVTDAGLRSVSLDEVGSIRLLDEKLNAELQQALLVLAQGKSSDKKTVSMNFLGEGERQVKVGYIQESPIWKTSYRLVLSDDDAPLLQGWAIVENTTENDWENVNLTLVSGRPISFIMDLYQPMYAQRPEVQMELYASLRPKIYDQDLAAAEGEFLGAAKRAEDQVRQRAEGLARRAAAPPAPSAAPSLAFGANANGRFLTEEKSAALDARQGFESVAQAGDVGEMFQYNIATPVTLARSRSAMLPIVNESIETSRVSIYNQNTQAKHPVYGLRLKNTTALHLMQGPITVFDDGAYAGDAQIADLQPGTQRLISYALDLDTEVAPQAKSSPDQLVSAKFNRGVFQITHKLSRGVTYEIKNSGKREKQVLIEYPLDNNWNLVKPAEASEKTRDLYRFEVAAKPGEPASLDVREERVQTQAVAASNISPGFIAIYLNAQVISDDVKKALQEIVSRKAKIDQAAARKQELERKVTVIEQEQNRIRQNMEQLPRDSDLYRRYVTKFTEQEDEIDALRKQVTAAVEEQQALQKSLDDYLSKLTVE